jgi:hypothetical protein
MQALFVELIAKVIRAPLLAGERGCRRPRGLLLEHPVHALVSAVLLGVAGFDPLGINPDPDPPDREAAEPPDRDGRERNSIV